MLTGASAEQRRMVRQINWSAILQRCQPASRQKILDLRSRHEDLTRQMTELRKALPVIDWGHYRQLLPKKGPVADEVDVLEAKARVFRPNVQDIQPALLLVDKEKEERVLCRYDKTRMSVCRSKRQGSTWTIWKRTFRH